jgi:Tfp pilus assembly protein PilV
MLHRIRARLRNESGQGLIEIMIALFFMAIAVAAIFTLMVSSAVSLQRAGQKGTALTLADQQLEYYRTIAYKYIRIQHNLVPGSGVYVTANSSDSTIPASSPLCTTNGQLNCIFTDGTSGETACGTTGTPTCLDPVQTVTGPDKRSYEIDTYMTYQQWTSATSGGSQTGRALKYVLIVVRDAKRSTKPILARAGSTFDQATAATG